MLNKKERYKLNLEGIQYDIIDISVNCVECLHNVMSSKEVSPALSQKLEKNALSCGKDTQILVIYG